MLAHNEHGSASDSLDNNGKAVSLLLSKIRV